MTSAAVAASMATARSGGRKAIVLRVVAEGARTSSYPHLNAAPGHRRRRSRTSVRRRFVGERAGVHPRRAACTGQPKESHVTPRPPYRRRRRCRPRRSGDRRFWAPAPASAHGFSSIVYVDVTSPRRGSRPDRARARVRPARRLRRRRRARRPALPGRAPPRSRTATPPQQAAALDAHAESVVAYVTERFAVTSRRRGLHADAGRATSTIERARGRAVRVLLLDWTCPEPATTHEVRSGLFPDAEGYVRGTKTIVTYDLDGQSGSAALDAEHPSFSTAAVAGRAVLGVLPPRRRAPAHRDRPHPVPAGAHRRVAPAARDRAGGDDASRSRTR